MVQKQGTMVHPIESSSICRRAIFGGTFDPPHYGHLHSALLVLQAGWVDQVIWTPTGRPPHKAPIQVTPFAQRAEMVRRTIAPYPGFCLSQVEAERPGPSYAIDTWQDLRRIDPLGQWYWLLGLDAFATLPRWRCREQLIPSCTWLVMPRAAVPAPEFATVGQDPAMEIAPLAHPSESLSTYQQQAHSIADQIAQAGIQLRWHLLDSPGMAVSARLIRQQTDNRQQLLCHVPATVADYIEQNGLYRAKGGP